jgi:acetyltransferase-like isoleucine patch superfamily enzyme
MALKHLVKLNRYPRYIFDYLLIYFYKYLWRKYGISIGTNTHFLGKPIFTKFIDSKIQIGKNCLLCSRAESTALGVSHPIIIRTFRTGSKIHIGDNVRMSGTTICSDNEIFIGDRCVIGSDVIIADTDFHSLIPEIRSSSNDKKGSKNKPIYIGNDVFIGAKSIILKGTNLGNNVVVGAGSVVTGEFEDNLIIAGNPAKAIKTLNDKD